MKSYREVAGRIVLQAEFLLSMKARAIYVLVVLVGIVYSLGTVYKAYPIVASFGIIGSMLLEVALIALAAAMFDEISDGTVQMYLAAGLSRLEYVVSWFLVAVVYPAAGITAAMLVPALVVDPATIAMPIVPYTIGGFAPSLLIIAIATCIQILNNVTVALALGLKYKSKGIAYLVLALLAFLMPLVLSMIVSFLGALAGDYYRYYSLYLLMLPFNPLYSLTIFSSSSPIRLSLTTILSVPAVVALVFFLLALYITRRELEV